MSAIQYKATNIPAKFQGEVPSGRLVNLQMRQITPTTKRICLKERKREYQEMCDAKSLADAYEVIPFKIDVLGRTTIRGTLYQNKKDYSRDVPTLIAFNGKEERVYLHESYELLCKAKTISLPFNAVHFDYRGDGDSDGVPSLKGFLADGAAVYEFVTQSLRFSPQSVAFYGFNTGGLIAANVKAEVAPHTKGSLIIDRSPTSLSMERYRLTNWVVDYFQQNLDLSALAAIRSMQDRVLVFNGEKDLDISSGLALSPQLSTIANVTKIILDCHPWDPQELKLGALFDPADKKMRHRVLEFISPTAKHYIAARDLSSIVELIASADDNAEEITDRIEGFPKDVQNAIKYQVHVRSEGGDGNDIVTNNPKCEALQKAIADILHQMPISKMEAIRDKSKTARQRAEAFREILQLNLNPVIRNDYANEEFPLGAISEEEHVAFIKEAYSALEDVEVAVREPFRRKLWKLNGRTEDAKVIFGRNPRDAIVLRALNDVMDSIGKRKIL